MESKDKMAERRYEEQPERVGCVDGVQTEDRAGTQTLLMSQFSRNPMEGG